MIYPTETTFPLHGLEWLQWYGPHNAFHPGIDIGLRGNSDKGQRVWSPKHGFIEYISPKPTIWNRQNSGYGWFVITKHDDGSYTRLAHLQGVEVLFREDCSRVKER